MSEMKVCEGLEIINVDGHYLETLKKTKNTIETGASQILEGLDMFAEDLLDKYEDEPSVPYEKLFYALKQVISSALENESVRDAIMTGVITETKDGIPVLKQPKKKVEVKVVYVSSKPKIKRNKSAITNYAKTHTVKEIYEHFNFYTINSTYKYLIQNGISYKKQEVKGKKKIIDVEKLVKLAPEMTLSELARSLAVSRQCVYRYCKNHNIIYKKRG